MRYAFNVTDCSHLIFQKLTFFGATMWEWTLDITNFINNLTFHSIKYPPYSRRILRDTAPALWTKVNANMNKNGLNTLTFFNNTFYGTDGVGLKFSGLNVTLDNSLLEYNDGSEHGLRTWFTQLGGLARYIVKS